MLTLESLLPVSIGPGARLKWQVGDRLIETDFDRFRPFELAPRPDPARTFDVIWRDFGDLPMTESFFNGTMEQAIALPNASAVFQTPINTLAAVAAQPDRLPFSGVIFHMARTGSTLIHRLFSRTGKVLSLSEVTLFDRAANLVAEWPEAERNAALHDLFGAFQRARRPNERHFITKMTDAMASLRLPIYRSAFPDVPWIFVYRDPVEIMVSATRRRTGNIEIWHDNRTQAAERLRMPELNDPGMWTEEFIARTLGRFCENAVRAARETPPGKFLAVSYSRLPDAVWETIAPHFGIPLTKKDRKRMRDEALFSAKRSGREFKPDSEVKRKEATKSMTDLAERFVAPAIEALRALPQG